MKLRQRNPLKGKLKKIKSNRNNRKFKKQQSTLLMKTVKVLLPKMTTKSTKVKMTRTLMTMVQVLL